MGYWLEDNDGKWLGDLATNKGIGQLREAGSPALKEFLDAGEADEKLAGSIVEEVEELPVAAYVAEMLGEAEGSVFVTDGCGSAEDGNQEEKHAQHDQSTHGRGGGGSSASLARPPVILGGTIPGVSAGVVSDYLEANGKEWEASKLPSSIGRGTAKECFRNASQLVMDNDELEYVEGIAYASKVGPELGFLHAWAVTKDGKVVDNTWDEPEESSYFGVKYSRKKYISHIMKTGMYGVIGGKPAAARKVLKEGGL